MTCSDAQSEEQTCICVVTTLTAVSVVVLREPDVSDASWLSVSPRGATRKSLASSSIDSSLEDVCYRKKNPPL